MYVESNFYTVIADSNSWVESRFYSTFEEAERAYQDYWYSGQEYKERTRIQIKDRSGNVIQKDYLQDV